MSKYTLKELENELAERKARMEELIARVTKEAEEMEVFNATFKTTLDTVTKDKWETRKRLYWLKWLEENDNDAYQILMATIHKTLLFKDVKFSEGHHVTGFNINNDPAIRYSQSLKTEYSKEQVHSGAKALQIAKWGLNGRREGGLNFKGWGKNPKKPAGLEFSSQFTPNLTSIIAEGDYWGEETSVLRDCWVEKWFSDKSIPHHKERRIRVAGLFNPCVAPNREIKMVCILKSNESKTAEFNAGSYEINNNGHNRGGSEDQNYDRMLAMVVKKIEAEGIKDIDGDEMEEHELLDEIGGFGGRDEFCGQSAETINWTRWMDDWRYTGVNLNGIHFNPLVQHCDRRETLREHGDQRILPLSDHKTWSSDWGFTRKDCFSMTKPQLLNIAERHHIYAPKSWSKHKIFNNIIKGNQYAKNGFTPQGWSAIA